MTDEPSTRTEWRAVFPDGGVVEVVEKAARLLSNGGFAKAEKRTVTPWQEVEKDD